MVDALSVVHSDPEISGGMPVFRGTRVPVQALFDYLEGGETLDQFLDPTADLPRPTRKGLPYAAGHGTEVVCR